MKKTAEDVTMDLLKDTAKTVDFTRMITEQQQFVDRAKRMAGTKPTKVEQAYIDEQRIKLNQLEDIVKNWIYEAFADQFSNKGNDKLIYLIDSWRSLTENFDITVVVTKKKN